MIRTIALLACLGGPAVAQGYGIPPALAPCADRHLDADRYTLDLVALGWIPIPAGSRAEQVGLLSETFVTMMAGRDDTWDERKARARTIWADLGGSQIVFGTANGEQALMVSGRQSPDGEAQLRCWLAFADGSRLDTLYAQILADADGEPQPGEEQVLILTPPPAEPDEALQIYLTRPMPDMDTPATRAGIATILAIMPDTAPGADE